MKSAKDYGFWESIGKAFTSFFDWLSGNSVPKDYSDQDDNFDINIIEPTISGNVLSYQISARLNVYDEVLATTSTTLNTFPLTISSTISEPLNVDSMRDNLGNNVANYS